MFLDIIGLLSENNPLFLVHLNNSLASACKLTSPDIHNKILSSVVQKFRNQIISEISQTNDAALIAYENTDISILPQLIIIFQ